jgi:hypothetical protein
MVGATIGISRPSQRDLPRDFVYDLTWPSQRDVSTVAQTLRDLPTLTNGLEAVVQNLPDLENWFLHQWMRYCMDRRFVMGDF